MPGFHPSIVSVFYLKYLPIRLFPAQTAYSSRLYQYPTSFPFWYTAIPLDL